MRDNTARLILGSLLRQADKTAIGDRHTRLSRAGLMCNVKVQADQLILDGVKSGEFVIVMCNRGLAFWTELLASWTIGAIPICIEDNISDEHAASILELASVDVIFGNGEGMTSVFSGLQTLNSTFDPSLATSSIRETFEELPFVADDDVPEMSGLIFTSGTTGLPKGVPLTHRALCANALATSQRLRLLSDDRLLIATPFRFISSISHFIVTLLSDAAFFGIEKTMMIKDLLEAMNSLGITAFGGSPFHMQFIAMAGKERVPKLRWAMSSGDHLRPAVIEQLSKSFDGLELHVVYGMAELGGRFCELRPDALSAKSGSVGYPINGFEISIRREDGGLCEPGEIGEIYVTGHHGFRGYFNNPAANEKVLGPFGFKNGDKGYSDRDGYVFLSGRSDSVFKRSGLKVSAQIISDALMSLDSVRDVFVSGKEDAMEGHVPVAYVCWEEEPLERSEITRMLRSEIPVNHLPARYVSLPTIPRTGSGKVDRRKLNALVEASVKSSNA